MATRLAFVAACRARNSAHRVAKSLRPPRQCLDPASSRWRPATLPVSLLTTSSTTAPRQADIKQPAPPPQPSATASTTAAPAEEAQARQQQPSDASAGVTSATSDGTKKPSPSAIDDGDGSSSGGASTDPAGSGSRNSSQGSGVGDGHGGGGSESGGSGDGGSRGPLSWGAVGTLGVVGALIVGYYRMKWEEKQNRVASEVTSTGKPALGGPFTLVNMHGRPVTEKDYHGSYVMLYFGFCHCPDICPSELVKVGSIADKLERKLGKGVVKPVFVSVDPDRDSLAQLRHYAQDFHPSMEFLTGTKDQVAKAAKAYRVYFSKTEEHEEGEDYLLDHSIVIYLLAPDGDFLDFFTQRTTITDCVDRTLKEVKGFRARSA